MRNVIFRNTLVRALWIAAAFLGDCPAQNQDSHKMQTVFYEDFSDVSQNLSAGYEIPEGWEVAEKAPQTYCLIKRDADKPFFEIYQGSAKVRTDWFNIEKDSPHVFSARIVRYNRLDASDSKDKQGVLTIRLELYDRNKQPLKELSEKAVLVILKNDSPGETFDAGFKFQDGYLSIAGIYGQGYRSFPAEGICYGRLLIEQKNVQQETSQIDWLKIEKNPSPVEHFLVSQMSKDSRNITMEYLWQNLTCGGSNLALGKIVTGMPKPDKGKLEQLVDGKIYQEAEKAPYIEKLSKLAGNSNAVFFKNTPPVLLQIDLGQTNKIARVVMRAQTGRSYSYPRQIDLLGSTDGKEFRLLQSWQKNGYIDRQDKYEFALNDWLRRTHIFPLTFWDVDAAVRYIGLRIHGGSEGQKLYMDEIAVIEGKADSDVRDFASFPLDNFKAAGAYICLQKDKLWIPNNRIIFDNSFCFVHQDLNTYASWISWQGAAGVTLDLPEGITLLLPQHDPRTKEHFTVQPWRKNPRLMEKSVFEERGTVEHNGKSYRRYVCDQVGRDLMSGIRDLVFETKLKEGTQLDGFIYAQVHGDIQTPLCFPIEIYSFQPSKLPEKLHVSLGWIGGPAYDNIPGLLETLKYLGFNAAPVFPESYREGKGGAYDKAAILRHVGMIRKAGLKLIQEQSPYSGLLSEGKKETSDTWFDDKALMAEARKFAEPTPWIDPDFIFYDIEGLSVPSKENPKMKAMMAKEGLAYAQARHKLGAGIYSNLVTEAKRLMKEAGEKVAADRPHVNSYYVEAKDMGFVNFFDIYPKYVQSAGPELYLAGDMDRVAQVVRTNSGMIGNNDVISWPSLGCYGEFPSLYARDMVLECFINGSRGITYYGALNFDGLDFKYTSEALNLVAEYEDIIHNGRWVKKENLPGISDPSIRISGMGKDDGEMLILLSNYKRGRKSAAKLTFKVCGRWELIDCDTQKTLGEITENTPAVSVPLDPTLRRTCLLHLCKNDGKIKWPAFIKKLFSAGP